ncbi:MAG: choice-of-anchor J domain-containing protein, partial [Candidatus Zixiibacteriota bacterium]
MTPQLAVGAGDVLKYWYRSESASYATSFYVRLSTSSDQSDTGSYTTLLADHSMITNTTYTEGVIDLSPYAAHLKKGQVYIAFHRYYGASDYWYLYLDDVMMPPIYVPPGDMATISIDDLPDFVQTGTSTAIKATVQNLGGDLASAGVPVKLRIEGPESYVYTDEEATTVDLATDETEQITFAPDWVAPEVLCNYTVTIWTELGGDAATDNDTLSQVVTVYRAGGLAESFTGTTFPPPGWTVYAFDGGDQWSRYTTYYHSDPACARIYYDSPNNDWLITPRLAAQDGDKLKFWWRVQSTSYEETVFVRVSTDPDVSDTSAYSIIHTIISNSTSWSLETVDLSSYAGQSIYIAWTYDNYNNYGFAIDDVTGPYFPTQIAVSPDNYYWESFPDSFFDVYMHIGNVGGGQLDYSIELETAVGWLSVNPTSGSALGGEEDTLTVSVNTTGLDGHYYNTIRVISNSGEKQDGDTVFVPVHLWVRLIPDIDIDPDSFAVEVPGDGTLDDNMYIHSIGSGPLDYEIATEEYGKVGAKFMGDPAHRSPGEYSAKPSIKEQEKGQREWHYGVSPTKGLGGPDAFGYKWIDSDEPGGPTFHWVEINTTGTPVDVSDDGNVGPFDIGFAFEFYGIEYTQFRIASNGFVSFTSTSGTLSNTTIPTSGEPNNLLALMWDDLRPASGGGAGTIYYEYDGLNRLIIEYDGVMRYGTTYYYTMQIILQSNGQIFYQYLTRDG